LPSKEQATRLFEKFFHCKQKKMNLQMMLLADCIAAGHEKQDEALF